MNCDNDMTMPYYLNTDDADKTDLHRLKLTLQFYNFENKINKPHHDYQ